MRIFDLRGRLIEHKAERIHAFEDNLAGAPTLHPLIRCYPGPIGCEEDGE